MKPSSRRSISLAIATLVGVVALACAGGGAPAAPAGPTPAQDPGRPPEAASAPTPATPSTLAPAVRPEPTPAQAPTQASGGQPPSTTTPEESPAPDTTPATIATSGAYDPSLAMYQLLPWIALTPVGSTAILEQLRERRDRSLVPVLVEVSRYMPTASSSEHVGSVLREVTGQNISNNDWAGTWTAISRHRGTRPGSRP